MGLTKKNKSAPTKIIWIAIIFLAIGIIVGFLISLNTSKTGNAMKAISNSEIGAKMNVTDNFSIEKTNDGIVTTYIQSYEDEKEGKIVTEKFSTITTPDQMQFTCNQTCTSTWSKCALHGCVASIGNNGDPYCTGFECRGNDCSGSCTGQKSSGIALPK